jgi:DNA-binding NarL/FixJ family response regulator
MMGQYSVYADCLTGLPDADLQIYCVSSSYCLRVPAYRSNKTGHSPPRLVVCTGWSETEAAMQEAGISGYLGPGCGFEQLEKAVEAVLEGGTVYHPGTTGERSIGPLTDRQIEVLQLIANGLTDKEIAAVLGIKESTVRHHYTTLCRKTETNRRAKLIRLAVQGGLVFRRSQGVAENRRRVMPHLGQELWSYPLDSLYKESDPAFDDHDCEPVCMK